MADALAKLCIAEAVFTDEEFKTQLLAERANYSRAEAASLIAPRGAAMAEHYQLGFWRRWINRLIRALLRVGISPPHTYLLTVAGRKTGTPYSTPVTLVEENEQRWLVAPYGDVGWVKNARVAKRVSLSRGLKSEDVSITELSPLDVAPVLKKYITEVPITRPFFDVTSESAIEDFVKEASRHPVFRITGHN